MSGDVTLRYLLQQFIADMDAEGLPAADLTLLRSVDDRLEQLEAENERLRSNLGVTEAKARKNVHRLGMAVRE